MRGERLFLAIFTVALVSNIFMFYRIDWRNYGSLLNRRSHLKDTLGQLWRQVSQQDVFQVGLYYKQLHFIRRHEPQRKTKRV